MLWNVPLFECNPKLLYFNLRLSALSHNALAGHTIYIPPLFPLAILSSQKEVVWSSVLATQSINSFLGLETYGSSCDLIWNTPQHSAHTPKGRKAGLRSLHHRIKMRTRDEIHCPCRLRDKRTDSSSQLIDFEFIQLIFSTFNKHEIPPGS